VAPEEEDMVPGIDRLLPPRAKEVPERRRRRRDSAPAPPSGKVE